MEAEEKSRQKYRARVQYLGTRYSGWQIQRNQTTIQGVLTEALERLAKQPVSVVGSGRTDAGVHARGQVCHFLFPDRPTIPDLLKAINANLPWDIRLMDLRPAPDGFHAQKWARKKRYDYLIFNGPVVSPFLYHIACHVRRPLDLAAMQEGAARLVGKHDFLGFAAASLSVKTTERTIFRSELTRKGTRIRYRVEAGGFLHHMVRNIAGTLIEIGRGRMTPDHVSLVLERRDRTLAGPTADARGLCLQKVWY